MVLCVKEAMYGCSHYLNDIAGILVRAINFYKSKYKKVRCTHCTADTDSKLSSTLQKKLE